MNLTSGYPYFLLKTGLGGDFERLDTDIQTDVAILGGGVSGALVAHALLEAGLNCVVLDRRKIGLGSTAASTSLLQYELDVPLHQLIKRTGREKAVMAWQQCAAAIERIRKIANQVGHAEFEPCNSVLFLHDAKKAYALHKELGARIDAGLPATFLRQDEVFDLYRLLSPGAIVSGGAAKLNTFRFTLDLHRYNMKRGLHVFENTGVCAVRETERGVVLQSENGFAVKARKIVYATGYEATEHISDKRVRLRSTFALATERTNDLPDGFRNTVFWNTDDPYLYFREDDGRLIIGGRDANHSNPARRSRQLPKKTTRLMTDFRKTMLTGKLKPAFAWAGTFGSTTDGLPFIGQHPGNCHCFYALGYGGNGITFSALAADLIAQSIKTGKNRIPEMYGFER